MDAVHKAIAVPAVAVDGVRHAASRKTINGRAPPASGAFFIDEADLFIHDELCSVMEEVSKRVEFG